MLLMVKEGDRYRDLVELKVGGPILVGRLPQCHISFPDDIEMSGRHLSIGLQSDGACAFKDLGSTNGTFLDESAVFEGQLKQGAVLRCGLTQLCVQPAHRHTHFHEMPGREVTPPSTSTHREGSGTAKSIPPSGGNDQSPGMIEEKGFVSADARQICKTYSLSESLKLEPKDGETPADYATRLAQSCDENESLQFLAFALPKRMAVWWLIQCVKAAESFKSNADLPMLAAAEDWVSNPTEENRRKGMKLAEQLQMASPAAWAGVGAFWSHGSMAPADAPAVPAADNLSGKAIFGGVVLAAVLHTPEKAPERRLQFTQLALKIAEGKLAWK